MPNGTVPAAAGGMSTLDALDKVDAVRELIEVIFMASGALDDEMMERPIKAVCNVAGEMLRDASEVLTATFKRRA